MNKMDHFFGCVASLMSILLRSCVANSIYDLVDLVEEYADGNSYDVVYNIFQGLALPQKIHPVTFFMVSWEQGFMHTRFLERYNMTGFNSAAGHNPYGNVGKSLVLKIAVLCRKWVPSRMMNAKPSSTLTFSLDM